MNTVDTHREIKFRAWDKEKKGFIAGFNMVNFHSYYNKGLEPEIYRYDTTWKLSQIELQQYTGLKDKNGIEIYEGDILNNPELPHFVVWYNNSTASFDILFDGDKTGDTENLYEYLVATSHELEVIGNIYSNPELLKQE